MAKAFLILEDGSVFEGIHIGAEKEIISEIVFNTSMTGYLEVLTDPSYAGQAVAMTYPLIGNYGVAYEDMESIKAWPDGYIVREISRKPSNFRSQAGIEEVLIKNGIPGIMGIDTRALTRTLREKGTMNGMITMDENYNLSDILPEIKKYRVTGVVKRVSRKKAEDYVPGDLGNGKKAEEFASGDLGKRKRAEEFASGDLGSSKRAGGFVTDNLGDGKAGTERKAAVLDFGVKNNIIRCLLNRGCKVRVFPAYSKAEEILAYEPDGIMLTNGPGDPAECVEIIGEIKKLAVSGVPIFAICLGHQLMALANGGTTEKMKYGHRGVNHPVKDLKTGRVYISSQNHGYVVTEGSIPPEIGEPSFINVNDKTIEGMRYKNAPIYTVQFHPEACGGPKDSEFLFDEFFGMMK